MSLEPVKAGLVGLGSFGEVHARALSQMQAYDLVAVCSRSPERARELAARYGARRWYTDPHELAQDPEIELVDVVTEVARHAKVAQVMLAAGKHVLVEKPLAATLKEVEITLEMAGQHGRILMVGYIERFDPRRAMIQQRIAAGALGKVVSLYGRRNCGRQYLSWPRFQQWPLVIEPGIHTVDMLIWLAGAEVERVFAVARCHNPWQVNDTWWATLEFAGGAIGVIEQVWQLPTGCPAEWQQDNALEVIGTEGTIQMRDPTDAFWTWDGERTESPDFYLLPEVDGQVVGALHNELAYLARCIVRNQPPRWGTPAEIRHATQVALAIVRSAQMGQPVMMA